MALVSSPRFLLALTFILLTSCARRLTSPPRPAIPAMLEIFDRYPVILLGEDHWLRQAGEFYISLVTNPEFPKHANTLVLECGNSLYQPILDRYENGEDIPFDQISQVWRNTTKLMGFDSPIYSNLMAAVRERNRKLPEAERIRVIAADSPIDWSRVQNEQDYSRAFGGNGFFASIIEREVFAKNRKGLVIMGDNHVARGGDRWGNADVTDMLERDHHPTYVVMLTNISTDSDRALRGTDPSFYVLRGTRLGAQPYFSRHMEDAADAYLYLGRKLETAYPDWNAIEADKAYFSEIQRRYPLEFGCSLNLETWKGHDRPCQ